MDALEGFLAIEGIEAQPLIVQTGWNCYTAVLS